MKILGTQVPFVEQVEKSDENISSLAVIPPETEWKTFLQLFEKAYQAELIPKEILKMLEKGTHYFRKIALKECLEREDRLLYEVHLGTRVL